MEFENISSSEIDQLETKHRDFLQIALVKEVFPQGSTTDQRNQWFLENARKISEIIDGDNEEAREIRRLAREEQYEEAAKILKELL